MNPYKLIVETIDPSNLEYLCEQKNKNEDPKYYIQGPFIMTDEKNHNGRIYESTEMDPAVDVYIEKYVKSMRGLGEMGHPDDVDVNLERACDKLVSLHKEGNFWIGKAVCLSTPMGKLQESLIRDGVKIGKSTRCLGQLTEGEGGVNYVKSPNVRAIDTVWEPSGQGKDNSCFVNGILENREFIIRSDNQFEVLYDKFNNALSKLPRKDVNDYITENIINFINGLRNK
jgi:hypothetical protein